MPSGDPWQATRADAFVDSIGVNTHVGYGDSPYGDVEGLLKPSLKYLGVRHIRDGLADDDFMLKPYRQLRALGIGVTGIVPYQIDALPALLQSIRAQRDVLEAVEGPNETDLFTQFRYLGQPYPAGTVAFMKDFYPAIKADPALQHLPVLQTTLAFPGAAAGQGTRADLLGDLSAFADYGNSHNYFAFGEPPGPVIREEHLPLNTAITPGKPMMSSEGGYQMGRGDGYKGTWNDGQAAPFAEAVHGRYLLRYLLEQYRQGYRRSFVYELLDSDQPQWGLFRADGTPRPAASGIRNLIQQLSEGRLNPDTGRWTTPDFAPGRLDYRLSGQLTNVHSLLLQRSSGAYYLVLWNEVNNWNVTTGAPIYPPPAQVELSLAQPVRQLQTFLPLTRGATPTATFTTAPLRVEVPDHPVVVKIELK